MLNKNFLIPTKRKVLIWSSLFIVLLIIPLMAMYINPVLSLGVGIGALLIAPARQALVFYLYLDQLGVPESLNFYTTALLVSIVFYVLAAIADSFYEIIKHKIKDRK